MRFIDRHSLRPPDILSSKRADQAREEVQSFYMQTISKGGTRRTPSSAWLTQDERFRSEVHSAFESNCAYCEQLTDLNPKAGVAGTVSHHRPESLAQDQRGNTDLTAYSWLTYDWNNILWVCNTCHRRKENQFFVRGRRGDIDLSVDRLRENEDELLLDPCYHNPSKHLQFHLDGTVSGITEEGTATIRALDLNRSDLIDSRQICANRLLDILAKEPEQIIAVPTGAKQQSGAFVFSITESSIPRLEHPGASTDAILEVGLTLGMKAISAEDFLREFSDDYQIEFAEFRNRTLPEQAESSGAEIIETPQEPASETSPQSVSSTDRLLSIKEMPAALAPITRVSISNFKTLRDITFDLPKMVADPEQSPCMILLGENGTGKSSVLEAMTLAVIGADEANELNKLLKDEEISPVDMIHRPDPSRWDEPNDRLDIRLNFVGMKEQVHIHAEKGDTLFSGPEHNCKVVLGYGPRRYFTNRKTRRYRVPAQRVRSLFDPLDMIANPIHWLTDLDDDKFYAAARALREILMLDEEDDFERDDDANTRGQIFIRQHGQRTALQDLSVGYKSVIAMACDIIRELLYHFDNIEFAHAIVFIDEIETHLHPRWKLQIMQLLRKAFPKVQLIVTTHDPLCLRGMYEGEVFVLQRNASNAQVEKIEDLPSIRGMRAEQILTSEFFGLGSTDPETDAQLARYNMLASRQEDLDDAENDELNRLRVQLDDNMIIGSTIAEQAYAEALKEQVKDKVHLTRVDSPRRGRLKERFSSLFDKSNVS